MLPRLLSVPMLPELLTPLALARIWPVLALVIPAMEPTFCTPTEPPSVPELLMEEMTLLMVALWMALPAGADTLPVFKMLPAVPTFWIALVEVEAIEPALVTLFSVPVMVTAGVDDVAIAPVLMTLTDSLPPKLHMLDDPATMEVAPDGSSHESDSCAMAACPPKAPRAATTAAATTPPLRPLLPRERQVSATAIQQPRAWFQTRR